TFGPFIEMWSTVPLARYFMNSLVVTSVATLCSVVVAIFAAYAVSRWRFRGRTPFMTTVLSTQMFPGVLFLLPLYLIFVNIDTAFGVPLVGTRIGLIITYLTFSLPFSIWMLAGYFDGIPRELDQAGKVDGAGNLTILLRIILPGAPRGGPSPWPWACASTPPRPTSTGTRSWPPRSRCRSRWSWAS